MGKVTALKKEEKKKSQLRNDLETSLYNLPVATLPAALLVFWVNIRYVVDNPAVGVNYRRQCVHMHMLAWCSDC